MFGHASGCARPSLSMSLYLDGACIASQRMRDSSHVTPEMKSFVHYSVKTFFCFVFSNISSFYVAWSVLRLDSLFCLFEWQKPLNHSYMSFLNLKVAAAVWVWERSLLWIICLSFRASWPQFSLLFCSYWISHRWLTTESLNIWSYLSPWLSCRGDALFWCVECRVPTDTGYLCSLLTASKSSQQLINWLTSYLGLVFDFSAPLVHYV